MYGGDEVSALVLDVGSHTCKAGYAGEDTPKAVFPSVVGAVEQVGEGNDAMAISNGEDGVEKTRRGPSKLYVGGNALGYRRDNMEVIPTLRNGLVAEWDLLENIWQHALTERLVVDPIEHPMLMAEPSFNTAANREKMVELMFEKHRVPALFLAKNAVLTSFASGRATSLVVDSGGGSTVVAAVHEGYVLQKAIMRSPVGGDVLTDCLLNTWENKGIKIKPRYSFKKKEMQPGEYEILDLDLPHTTASYRRFAQRNIVESAKEAICRIPESAFEENAYANIPTQSYELPDGTVIEVGADRFRIPEVMFRPSIIQNIAGVEKLTMPDGSPLIGLPTMVIESINKCDVEIRRELFNSILLAGGNSNLPSMKERLEKELVEEAPQTARVKVISSGSNMERRFSVWIGGSILASLGSFQQMWFSKSEYEEHGAQYVQRKCP